MKMISAESTELNNEMIASARPRLSRSIAEAITPRNSAIITTMYTTEWRLNSETDPKLSVTVDGVRIQTMSSGRANNTRPIKPRMYRSRV
jgi:hypothetical protein